LESDFALDEEDMGQILKLDKGLCLHDPSFAYELKLCNDHERGVVMEMV
jgi:hypothetical protein